MTTTRSDAPPTPADLRLNMSGLTDTQHRLLHAMIAHRASDGTVRLSGDQWRAALGRSTASAPRLMHHCERLAATVVQWRRGRTPVRIAALLAECRLDGDTLNACFTASVAESLDTPDFAAILAVDRRRLLKRPMSRRLYDVLSDMAGVGTHGWWPLERLWQQLHPRQAPPPPPPLNQFKRRIIEPALAELDQWTGLAVAVDYRRGDDGTNAVRFHVAWRNDPEPVCMLMPRKDSAAMNEAQTLEQAFDMYKASRACEITGRMSAADRADLEQAFADSIRQHPILAPKYQADGLDNLSVRIAYEAFLEHRLLPEQERDLDWFSTHRPDRR